MKANDVKTLIAALTTERDAIDRAVQSLRQMSDMRGETVQAAPSVAPRKVGRKKGYTVSAEARARMAEAQRRRHANARAAMQNNGNGTEPQPESSASAIGVQ